MTDLLSSFVACLCKRDSGRRKNRRSDVSYRGNLLPLGYAQRAHKSKGRAVWTDNPDSSSKEQRARYLRMTDIFLIPMPLAPSVQRVKPFWFATQIFLPFQGEHESVPLVRRNKRGFWMTEFLLSFVACLCKRDSGRRTNRRSDVSYSDNLLPLSYAQRALKFKGRAVWTENPDSSSKEQRARHLRMTDIFLHPNANAIGDFGSKG